MALGPGGDLAVVADALAGLLAPDEGPPRAGRHGAQDGVLCCQRLLPGGVRGGPEFAVDFVLVGVGQGLVEQAVGAFEFEDLVGGQEGRKALLPVVMGRSILPLACGVGA